MSLLAIRSPASCCFSTEDRCLYLEYESQMEDGLWPLSGLSGPNVSLFSGDRLELEGLFPKKTPRPKTKERLNGNNLSDLLQNMTWSFWSFWNRVLVF